VGTCRPLIVEETQRLLDDDAAYAAMAAGGSPYGDGRAAERIAAAVAATMAQPTLALGAIR
jgi:UDP-N-acetylglucosamine 2-epimerase (non-hydrolysing)